MSEEGNVDSSPTDRWGIFDALRRLTLLEVEGSQRDPAPELREFADAISESNLVDARVVLYAVAAAAEAFEQAATKLAEASTFRSPTLESGEVLATQTVDAIEALFNSRAAKGEAGRAASLAAIPQRYTPEEWRVVTELAKVVQTGTILLLHELQNRIFGLQLLREIEAPPPG